MLLSMGSQRVGCDLVTEQQNNNFIYLAVLDLSCSTWDLCCCVQDLPCGMQGL